jgi:hypothetical protein
VSRSGPYNAYLGTDETFLCNGEDTVPTRTPKEGVTWLRYLVEAMPMTPTTVPGY